MKAIILGILLMPIIFGNNEKISNHLQMVQTQNCQKELKKNNPNMGVDVSIKVRFLNKKNEKQFEVKVSDQDNSLESLLQSSNQTICGIKYTNIIFDRTKILSEEQNKMFAFKNTVDMQMESEIVDAEKAYEILEKLYWQIDLVSRKTAILHIVKSNSTSPNKEEEIPYNQISTYREYSGFNHSFSTFLGIVKTAAQLKYNIQIVLEYY